MPTNKQRESPHLISSFCHSLISSVSQASERRSYALIISSKLIILPDLPSKFDVKIYLLLCQIHTVISRDIEFESAVGARVRKLREKFEWSQEHLAAMANLESNQIYRVEAAKNTTSLAIITAIAKALGRQPYELLKTDFEVEVNDKFDLPFKENSPGTTKAVTRLASTSFFNTPRSVEDVVKQCYKLYKTELKSSATSGALRKLIGSGVLSKITTPVKGRYLYVKK
jgi:transcriptional regulator with XRE-family HTH domain